MPKGACYKTEAMSLSKAVSVLTGLYLLSSLLLPILTNIYPVLLLPKKLAPQIMTGLANNNSNNNINNNNNNTLLAALPEYLWTLLYVNQGISSVIGKFLRTGCQNLLTTTTTQPNVNEGWA